MMANVGRMYDLGYEGVFGMFTVIIYDRSPYKDLTVL